ncbi:non-ribosomal peptide synthetase [Corynebacterium meridianum]|uniref:Amino acid adenylation domain-containing protein n=1 Tax=Corynebacterium meridianum TaxID=2765363 RepID=A0A934M7X8_9CORY|nr:non-ribosomal peptide synthetase [Corynebacterium meridianum]MBI8990049.1 amino acid adenylation domain-containing protein [Corynebacterium meridianum]
METTGHDMTPGQAALWFAQAATPGSTVFQCAELIEFHGDVEIGLLSDSIRECLGSLAPVRWRFLRATDGKLRAEPDPEWTPASIIIRTGELADDTTDWITEAVSVAAMTDGESISGAELTGHHIMRRPDGTVCWFARFHHILADGYAIAALIRWIAATYTARTTGGDAPRCPFSPGHTPTSPEAAEADVAYWMDPDRRPDKPPAALITGEDPARGVPLRAQSVIETGARQVLRTLARENRATELDLLTALTAHYTAAMTGSDRVTLGVPLMNRPLGAETVDFAPAVNLLPLTLDTSALGDPLPKVIPDVARALAGLRTHGAVRGEHLRRLWRISDPTHRITGPTVNLRPFTPRFRFGDVPAVLTTISVGPVSDIEFIYQSEDDGSMTLHGLTHGDGVRQAELDAHTRRLAALINRLAGQTDAKVESFGQLDLIDGSERRTILERFNDTGHPPGTATTLQERVLSRREYDLRSPAGDADALWWNGEWLRRREFWGQVDRLAVELRRNGARPGALVALQLNRSPALCIAVVATVVTGAAWVPLDPGLPAERRRQMVETAAPGLLVTAPGMTSPHPDLRVTVTLGEDTIRPVTGPDSPTGPPDPVRARPTDTAHVLFTSGSTGTPKGVSVPQEGILNRLEWMASYYRLDPTDTLIQKTPVSFDVSGWELLLPFTHGPRLAVPAPGAHRDPEALLEVLRAAGVTVCHFVPSALDAFLAWTPGAVDVPELRAVITSGEALSVRTAAACRGRLDVEVHNLYGPTEASIDVTAHTVTGKEKVIPIGAPVWNTRTYVLDPVGRLLPVGAPGRLFLAGVQVATGYVGRPDLTAERFTTDPFTGAGRMYDSGDIARWTPDGELIYLGRTDTQIKLRGQRLEPGEIEEVLESHPRVDRCVVRIHPATGSGGDGTLVAWVVPAHGAADPDPDQLVRHCRRLLPDYMVPRAFVPLPELPVTANGKLDTGALPAPVVEACDGGGAAVPGDPLEAMVSDAFTEVLGVRPGVDRNFFDLGGTSLNAVTLAWTVRDRTGFDVGVPDIFGAPSVRQLTATLRDRGAGSSGDAGFAPLLALRPHRAGIPVFCFHPAGGIGWSYARLIPLLDDPRRGVFAVQSPGLTDGCSSTVESITSGARRAANDLLGECARHGVTEVDLLGWSVGGVLAQACAVELADSPVRVRKLVLLDAYPAELWRGRPAPDDQERLRGVLIMAGQDPEDHPAPLRTADVVAALRDAPGAFGALPDDMLATVTEMIGHNARIMREHRTVRWAGTVHIFRAERNPEYMDETAWDPFCTALRVHSIDVTHPGMVSPEALTEVAELLVDHS